jgi:protein tyrosine phosphatase
MPACGDFYQLIAQERIGVVLMLCSILEGGREKCCHYFGAGTYGHMKVDRPKDSPTRAPSGPTVLDGFFSTRDVSATSPVAAAATSPQSSVQCRTLFVSDTDQPDKRPHQVQHIQYAAWPDFDVPPSADEVLDLIELANRENERMATANGLNEVPPILVHCSAGCGRTGCAYSNSHVEPR